MAEDTSGKIEAFRTRRLPTAADEVAPDGSEVRILMRLKGGGMAHFELPPEQTSKAVAHRTVEEIWFFLGGCGEMWRKQNDREEVVPVEPDVCLTIPHGTHFQFRSFGNKSLTAVGVTMPPGPAIVNRMQSRANGCLPSPEKASLLIIVIRNQAERDC